MLNDTIRVFFMQELYSDVQNPRQSSRAFGIRGVILVIRLGNKHQPAAEYGDLHGVRSRRIDGKLF